MKKINKLTFIFAFVLIGMNVQAQEKKLLTLNEAVKLGLENSKNLKIDAAKVQEATANFLEAKNNRLPSLKVSGTALALANADVNLKILAPSQNGGNAVKANSAFLGNVSASMPIYAGGKIKYGIQSAEYLIEAAKLNAENNQVQIAYNIAQAYNNLFKANQSIQVLTENLASSEKRDQTFLKLENNGVIARNDRLKANLQTSNLELQLLEAENNFKIATINMDLLLGLPESTEIEIPGNYIEDSSLMEPVSYYVAEAFKNRKDLQALDYQKKSSQLSIKSAKAESLPTLALTGGYIAAEVPNVLTVLNAANIGVGINYNIDNLWKKNSSLVRAEARDTQLSLSNELLNDQIKLEINRDYENAVYAQKRIAIYEKASLQADENYRVTKNKYDNGLATITELLDADSAQVVTHVNVINAKADAALAYRKLLQSTGTLNLQ